MAPASPHQSPSSLHWEWGEHRLSQGLSSEAAPVAGTASSEPRNPSCAYKGPHSLSEHRH